MKRSTNFNRWRRTGHSAADVADLLQHFGVTAEDVRAWARQNAGAIRRTVTCPRCGKVIEVEVNTFDGSAVCPACENDITIKSEK